MILPGGKYETTILPRAKTIWWGSNRQNQWCREASVDCSRAHFVVMMTLLLFYDQLGDVALDGAGTVSHDDDTVSQIDGLFDTVRDEHDGLLELIPDAQQLILEVAARERVERAERLVHQHNRRIQRQHTGDCHALTHAAGQVFGKTAAEVDQTELIQQLRHAGLDFGLGNTFDFQTEGDVLLHRHPGKQRVFLKHHAAIRAGFGHDLAVGDDAAAAGQGEAGDGIEQGRLAAAGWPQQADELAVRDVEVDVFQRHDFTVVALENLVDAGNDDLGCAHVSSPVRDASAACNYSDV